MEAGVCKYFIWIFFMSLTVDDLQLLVDIVACGSFSQAAARRAWSQPQVSQRVAALETELGVQLFTRHRRGALPTSAAQAFLPAARQALDALAQGRAALLGTPALPRVHLACMPSLASVVFGPLMVALAHAPIEIRCRTDHSPNIMEQLLGGQAQLGFVLKCPPIAGIHMERIWRSPIVPVVSKRHPLARGGAKTLADIANADLAPQYWGDACDELMALLHARRNVHHPIHAIQPASAARELALAHGFLTFVPEVVVKRDLREGRLVKLALSDLPLWEWDVMMAWRSGKRADPAKQRVLDAVRAMAPDWA